MVDLKRQLQEIGASVRTRFESEKRVLSFGEYLEQVVEHPARHTRDAARYLKDCFDYYGTEQVERASGLETRFKLFDQPFEQPLTGGRRDYLVGHERIQQAFYRALCNFTREGRANRLILLHGPNGSAKSTFANCLIRGLEHYSKQPEGAVYRFSWIFPRGSDGKTIGFGSRDEGPRPGESYAHLPESRIDAKLSSALREHPLLVLPQAERAKVVQAAYGEAGITEPPPEWIARGQLGQKNRQIFDALLTAYRGDLGRVLCHVQVERYNISRRYRTGAVTLGPQMAVDAGERQLTADTSLGSLPASLSALTLYEPYGELVDASGGVIEYSDLLKRPLDAWKYLLLAIETGEVSLPLSTLPINAVMLASSNELHLSAFKEHPDYHSFRGRIQMVRVPYLLDYQQEQKIYDAQVASQVRVHVAPHATYVAALWAVLTRLRRADRDHFADKTLGELAASLTPLEKAELYAERVVPKRLSSDEALLLKNGLSEIINEPDSVEAYEGLTGASPREIRTLLLDASLHPDFSCLSPLAVLTCIRALCRAGEYSFLKQAPEHGYQDHASFIEQVRDRWLDRVDDELRSSTGLVAEERYLELFERYINHVSNYVKNEKVYNSVTGAYEDPDAELMESIEATLGAGDDKDAFRKNLISAIAGHVIDHPGAEVDYTVIFPHHLERVKEAFFGERRKQVQEIAEDVLKLLANEEDHGLNVERTAAAKSAYEALCKHFGYQKESLRDALGELLRRRYRD